MKTDLARSRARKARRVEKVAENAALAWRGPGEPPPYLSGALAEPPKRFRTALGRSGKAKTRKPKRKKSPSLSKLKKELWKEISLLVRSWSPLCVACGGFRQTEVAAHIVPSNDGAATRYFLPNLYPACMVCNTAERFQRGSWVYKHREMFGEEFVDALYAFSETTFQLKKHWVIEQTERMKRLRGIA